MARLGSSSTLRSSHWPGPQPEHGSGIGVTVASNQGQDIYDDPYDFDVDADPYPVRMA